MNKELMMSMVRVRMNRACLGLDRSARLRWVLQRLGEREAQLLKASGYDHYINITSSALCPYNPFTIIYNLKATTVLNPSLSSPVARPIQDMTLRIDSQPLSSSPDTNPSVQWISIQIPSLPLIVPFRLNITRFI